MSLVEDNPLGAFLRDRRGRLDPKSLGFGSTRRRTPGLRREEVAQRANVSATWYTWLEQGRGGAPSTDVLDRLAGALGLTDAEREHLFLLAQRRPPEVRYQPPSDVTRRLQRTLDALEFSPALIKTCTWEVVAWNEAAAAVLTDYAQLPADRRNILRMLFHPSKVRHSPGWESDARMALATFRLESARAGAVAEVSALVEELSAASPEFRAMWEDNDVGLYVEGTKHLTHLPGGALSLDYTAFSVAGRPELGMIVYTPATDRDAEQVRALVAARRAEAR